MVSITTIDKEDNVEITVSFNRWLIRKDGMGGFGFPCDENGIVDDLKPLEAEDYRRCLSGEYDVVDAGIDRHEYRVRLCSCGSLKHYERVDDARGIFVANVCEDCRSTRLAGYRPEIFEDSSYEADEPIDEE
jgi:hypothetical protein